jgi:sorbitol-6-phosphate 2-dehydrogenase
MLAAAIPLRLRAPPPQRHKVFSRSVRVKAMAAPAQGADGWLGLRGKVALVTGGVSGLGRAISLELAQQGVHVVITDVRSEEEGLAAVEELQATSSGVKVLYMRADVSSPHGLPDIVAQAEQHVGPIHILVNNAGINQPALLVDSGGKHEVNDAILDAILAVNVKGVFHMTQAVARPMLHRGSGVIVNIASEAGQQGSLGQSAYAASKGALHAMTRSWAKEFAGKLRVVGVAPGVLEATGLRTPAYEEALAYTRGQTVEQLRAGYAKGILLGREARLGEVANVVAFLASPRASYIDGTVFNVTGGKSWV